VPAAFPGSFSRLEISMVGVGETAGMLEKVIGHLAEFAERELDVREKIRSAAAYPVFVLVLACVSVVVILAVIVPRVLGALGDVAALPWPTVVLMGLSRLLVGWGWLLAILAVGGVLALRHWLSRPAGRLAFDRFKLRLPVLGPALRRLAVSRFARTLGTLSGAGIGILEALHVLRDTLGNEALARKVDEVAAGVRRGESIAEPLRQTGEFPPLLIQVIALGERTGRLDELLLRTADGYEKETAAAIQRAMAVLPAAFIVLLAVVVLFVLAAVLLPIVNMETWSPGGGL
jgi:type II secretory pathway component PulF